MTIRSLILDPTKMHAAVAELSPSETFTGYPIQSFPRPLLKCIDADSCGYRLKLQDCSKSTTFDLHHSRCFANFHDFFHVFTNFSASSSKFTKWTGFATLVKCLSDCFQNFSKIAKNLSTMLSSFCCPRGARQYPRSNYFLVIST